MKFINDFYEIKIQPNLEHIKDMVLKGLTMNEIAKSLGISASAFFKYSREREELKDALAYAGGSVKLVENELFKKATGFFVEIEEPMKVRKVEYDGAGKKVGETEEFVMIKKRVFYPPDFNAQRFFLINRAPTEWRSEQPQDVLEEKLLTNSDEVLVKIAQVAKAHLTTKPESDKKEGDE